MFDEQEGNTVHNLNGTCLQITWGSKKKEIPISDAISKPVGFGQLRCMSSINCMVLTKDQKINLEFLNKRTLSLEPHTCLRPYDPI